MFVEIAVGNVKTRNIIIPIERLKQRIVDARDKNEELYRSYYVFDDEILEHLKVRKTIRGYKGKYYLKQIILDIDKGDRTDEITLIRAKEFCEILTDDFKMDPYHFKIFYSGRGYHFHMADYFGFEPSNFLPLEVKATIAKVFPEADTMPLMPTGLIRMDHTINNKVQRYKIRLNYDQLHQLSIEEIMEIAKEGKINRVEYGEGDYDFSKYKVLETFKKKEAIEANKPSGIVTCMQKMHNKGPVKGTRHETMLRFISKYSMDGTPLAGVKAILKDWAPDMEPAEINKMVNDTYKKQYQYGCQDHILKANCDIGCIYYKTKAYGSSIISPEQMEKNFVKFARSDYSKRIFDLGKLFKLEKPFIIYPGEFTLIIGDTGIGKTAFAQNISLGLKNIEIDFYCLEISERLTYRRNIQIEYGMTEREVMQYYGVNDNSLSERINHVHFASRSPDLFSLEKEISMRNRGLVIIDTIDGIEAGKLGQFKNSESKIAYTIKNICQNQDRSMIVVSHVPKGAILDYKGEVKKLTKHSPKGDSSLEQKCDNLIAIEGKDNSEYREVTVLKARDKAKFKFSCQFGWDTFKLIKIADLPVD